MFPIALNHSCGWRALKTNTRVIISTVPGSRWGGRESDVISQTADFIVPIGGSKYRGSF